jgi:hypothetical protein
MAEAAIAASARAAADARRSAAQAASAAAATAAASTGPGPAQPPGGNVNEQLQAMGFPAIFASIASGAGGSMEGALAWAMRHPEVLANALNSEGSPAEVAGLLARAAAALSSGNQSAPPPTSSLAGFMSQLTRGRASPSEAPAAPPSWSSLRAAREAGQC